MFCARARHHRERSASVGAFTVYRRSVVGSPATCCGTRISKKNPLPVAPLKTDNCASRMSNSPFISVISSVAKYCSAIPSRTKYLGQATQKKKIIIIKNRHNVRGNSIHGVHTVKTALQHAVEFPMLLSKAQQTRRYMGHHAPFFGTHASALDEVPFVFSIFDTVQVGPASNIHFLQGDDKQQNEMSRRAFAQAHKRAVGATLGRTPELQLLPAQCSGFREKATQREIKRLAYQHAATYTVRNHTSTTDNVLRFKQKHHARTHARTHTHTHTHQPTHTHTHNPAATRHKKPRPKPRNQKHKTRKPKQRNPNKDTHPSTQAKTLNSPKQYLQHAPTTTDCCQPIIHPAHHRL